MASLSAMHKDPRPWHTRSFYTARFFLLLVGILALSESLPGGFLSGLSIALVYDAAAIWVLAKGRISLSAPLTDESFAGRREQEALKLCAAYCGLAFGAAALCVLFAPAMTDPSNFIFRLVAIILLNVSGWHYMQWFREITALFKEYNRSKPVVVPVASVYKPITPQATPQTVRAGRSA